MPLFFRCVTNGVAASASETAMILRSHLNTMSKLWKTALAVGVGESRYDGSCDIYPPVIFNLPPSWAALAATPISVNEAADPTRPRIRPPRT